MCSANGGRSSHSAGGHCRLLRCLDTEDSRPCEKEIRPQSRIANRKLRLDEPAFFLYACRARRVWKLVIHNNGGEALRLPKRSILAVTAVIAIGAVTVFPAGRGASAAHPQAGITGKIGF